MLPDFLESQRHGVSAFSIYVEAASPCTRKCAEKGMRSCPVMKIIYKHSDKNSCSVAGLQSSIGLMTFWFVLLLLEDDADDLSGEV